MKNFKKVIWISMILATTHILAQEETSETTQPEQTAWSQVTGMFRGTGHMIMVEELPINKEAKTSEIKVVNREAKESETNRQAKAEKNTSTGEKTAP